jgi:hypothetical protein
MSRMAMSATSSRSTKCNLIYTLGETNTYRQSRVQLNPSNPPPCFLSVRECPSLFDCVKKKTRPVDYRGPTLQAAFADINIAKDIPRRCATACIL